MVTGTLTNDSVKRTRPLAAQVDLSEITTNSLRLDASAYGVEARSMASAVRECGYPYLQLYGVEDGCCDFASNGFRFSRTYTNKQNGIPFISSSEIIESIPKPARYLRSKTSKISELLIQKNDVLISCSGTVGNVALAGSSFAGAAASQHMIRLRAKDPTVAGFAAAFLRSRYGRAQVAGASYGSVVSHIEPHHLREVVIPAPTQLDPDGTLGALMLDATSRRDRAVALLDQADETLMTALGLAEPAGSLWTSEVRLSELADRFDASYHDPDARQLENYITSRSDGMVLLGDSDVGQIWPITKFRKRVYVRDGGIRMLSSKQIFQIDPIDVKRLARGAHEKDLAEIELTRGMLLITRSGTLGKVQLVHQYMDGWVASEHATRVLPRGRISPEYLFVWLRSVPGSKLMQRYSYGSVIRHIDAEMFARVPVPLVRQSVAEKVTRLAAEASSLLSDAWHSESRAIAILENRIAAGTPSSSSRV